MRLRTAGLVVLGVIGVGALGVLLAAWPATVALAAVVAVGLLLAWRMPPLAIVMGLLMLGFEGSIKVLLGLEDSPLPGGNRAAGAAAIDLVLFAGVVGVLVRDRGRTPLALWRRLGRAERVATGLLAAWLVVSVPQVAQAAHLSRGLEGLRLFQAYVLVGIAAAVLFTLPRFRRQGVVVLLLLGLAVGLYAAIRVVVGAAPAEIALATDSHATTMYGSKVRAVGSFSGAVGLNSYLVPLALFGVVLGLLVPRYRRLAWAVTALSIAPIAASYARTPLLGVLLALGFMLVVLLSTSDMSVRRKLAVLGGAVLVLAGTYGAIYLASRGTPLLRRRAHGILDPFDDKSMRDRFDAWGRALDRVRAHPLGAGSREGTPDNSFLKVLVEQGVLVGAAFLAGLLGVVVTIARRLRGIEGEARGVGLAALTGFVGFLGLCLVGDTVQQPGKAIAWTMLGLALVASLGAAPVPALAERVPSWSLAAARRRVARVAAPAWIATAVALVLMPVAITLGRSPGFKAEVELIPHGAGPYRPVSDPRHYPPFYADRSDRARIEHGVGLPVTPGPYRSVELARAPAGRVRLSVTLGSAADARRFARALARHIVAKAEDQLAIASFAGRGPIEDKLKTPLSRAERREYRRELEVLLELAHERPTPVTAGRAVVVTDRDWGDHVVEVIPGFGSPQPEAFWVGVAGAVVALALWLAALLVARTSSGGGTFAPMGSRRLCGALAVAAVAACGMAGAAIANSPGSTDALRLTTTKTNASTGVFATEIFNARYPNGQLKPLRQSLIGFPKGTRFDTMATPTCRATDADFKSEGMSACPDNTRIGDGTAQTQSSGAPFPIGPVDLDATVFATPRGSLIVFSRAGTYLSLSRVVAKGRFQHTTPPVNCVVVSETPPCEHGEFVPRSLTVDIPAHQRRVNGRLHRMITTPRHCTRSGRWWFFDKHTFADKSYDRFVNRPRCSG